jgi:hypothetical protein
MELLQDSRPVSQSSLSHIELVPYFKTQGFFASGSNWAVFSTQLCLLNADWSVVDTLQLDSDIIAAAGSTKAFLLNSLGCLQVYEGLTELARLDLGIKAPCTMWSFSNDDLYLKTAEVLLQVKADFLSFQSIEPYADCIVEHRGSVWLIADNTVRCTSRPDQVGTLPESVLSALVLGSSLVGRTASGLMAYDLDKGRDVSAFKVDGVTLDLQQAPRHFEGIPSSGLLLLCTKGAKTHLIGISFSSAFFPVWEVKLPVGDAAFPQLPLSLAAKSSSSLEIFKIKPSAAHLKFRSLVVEGDYRAAQSLAEAHAKLDLVKVALKVLTLNCIDDAELSLEPVKLLLKFVSRKDTAFFLEYALYLTRLRISLLKPYRSLLKIVLAAGKRFAVSTDLESAELVLRGELYRLESYCKVRECLYDTSDLSHWELFKASDLVDELKLLLSKGRVSAAITLFRRHKSMVLLDRAADILYHLPSYVPLATYDDWLKSEVMPYLDEHQLDDLQRWVECIALRYESIENDPRKAYDLTQLMQHQASSGNLRTQSIFQPSSSLLTLQSQLQECVDLCLTFGCQVSLAMLQQVPRSEIALSMLKRLTEGQSLKDEVTARMRPYCKAYQINADLVLDEYVQAFCKDWFEPHLKAKAAEAVGEIKDTEIKAKNCLSLVSISGYPLSAELKELLSLCLKSLTPYSEELDKVRKLAEIHEVLQLYQVSIKIADRLQVATLIKLIAKQGGGFSHISKFEGVNSLLRLEDLQFRYLLELIDLGRLQEFSEFSKACPALVKLKTLKYCIDMTDICESGLYWETSADPQDYFKGIDFSLCLIDPADPLTPTLKSMRRVAESFKFYLTPQAYDDHGVKQLLLRAVMQPYLEQAEASYPCDSCNYLSQTSSASSKRKREYSQGSNKRVKLTSMTVSKVYLLADLLRIGNVDLKQAFSLNAARAGLTRQCIEMCKELIDAQPSCKTGTVLHEAVQLLLKQEDTARKCSVLLRTSQAALRLCEERSIAECLCLCERLAIGEEVLVQSQDEAEVRLETSRCDRLVDDRYVEESMTMESASALAHIGLYLQSPWEFNRPLANYLEAHQHLLLSIRVLAGAKQVSPPLYEQLLRKVLQTKDADYTFTIALLMEAERPFDLLRELVASEANRELTEVLTCLAMDAAALLKQPSDDEWVNARAFAYWRSKLAGFDIQLTKEALQSEQLPRTLSQLLDKSKEFAVINEFCGQFGLSSIEAYRDYLHIRLLRPKIKPRFKELQHLSAEDLSRLLDEEPFEPDYCEIYPDLGKADHKPFIRVVSACLKQIPQYDYSRVTQLIQLTQAAVQTKCFRTDLLLMEALKGYRRKCSPSLIERQELLEVAESYDAGVIKVFTALLEARLPVRSIKQNNALLQDELDIETLPMLLPIAELVDVKPRQMRLTALLNSSNRGGCSFEEVKTNLERIKHIRDRLDFGKALIKAFPLGEDSCNSFVEYLIETALNCRQILQKANSSLESIDAFISTMQFKLMESLTLQDLKQMQLGEHLYEFRSSPEALIEQLLSRPPEAADRRAVTAFIEKVAVRAGLDLRSIKLRLLDQVLREEDGQSSEHAVSFYYLLADEHPTSFKRLVPLASDVPSELVVPLVLELCSSPSPSYKQKSQAISLLFSQYSRSALAVYLATQGLDCRDLLTRWRYFNYMADFNSLKVPYDLATLMSCDKLSLARSLVKNHSQQLKAVQLVAALCIDFRLKDCGLWKALLQAVYKLGAFDVGLCAVEEFVRLSLLNEMDFSALQEVITQLLLESVKRVKRSVVSFCKRIAAVLTALPESEALTSQVLELLVHQDGLDIALGCLHIAHVHRRSSELQQVYKLHAAHSVLLSELASALSPCS